MGSSIADLCATFRERAEWTNDIIRTGYATRLGILEESITDYHLLEFARRHKSYVCTRKFSRREEGSRSGADWLWCVGGPEGWLLLLVQAKIVNPASGTCLHLDYKEGRQRQQLVQYAKALGAIPMYCVYSHLSGTFMPASRRVASSISVPLSQWACTFVAPREIRRLAKKRLRTQSAVLSVGLPWSIPFCHAGADNGKGLADTAAEGFAHAKRNAEEVEQGALMVAEGKREVGPRREKSGPVEFPGHSEIGIPPGDASPGSLIRGESREDPYETRTRKRPTLSKRPRFSWEDADATALVTRHFPKAVAQIFSGHKISSRQARLLPASVSILSTEPIQDELARVEELPDSISRYRALRSLFNDRMP